MKQKLTALLLVGLLITGSGCMQSRRASSGAAGRSSSSQEEEVIFEWEKEPEPEESSPPVPEMPEMSLYDWWRDYLYDAVYSLQGDYPTLVQYDSSSVLEYCGIRMFRDGVVSEAGKEAGDSLLPKDRLAEYTMRYFNIDLDNMDISRRASEDGSGFLCYLPVGSDLPGENPANESLNNNDVFLLTEAAPADSAGVIRLTVAREDGLLTYFDMAPHQDGSGYYFKQITRDEGELPKEVQFTGGYITADTLLGMPANGASSLRFWGEIDGKMLLSWAADSSAYVILGLVDSYDLTEQRYEFPLKEGELFLSAIPQEERIVLITNQRIATRDVRFEDPREVPIPEKIKNADGSVPDFALSNDRKKAAFVDERGLCLYDFNNDSVKLLAEHPNYDSDAQGKESMENLAFTKPAFIDSDARLYCNIAAYEGYAGLYLYDLTEGEGFELDAAYSWVSNATVVGNKAFAFGLSSDQSVVPHLWLDLTTEETHTIELPYEIKTVTVAPSRNGLLVLGSEAESPGSSDGWRLFRMDMDTMQLNDTGFSTQGIHPDLLGAADNGRLLFSYYSFDGGGGNYLLANTDPSGGTQDSES